MRLAGANVRSPPERGDRERAVDVPVRGQRPGCSPPFTWEWPSTSQPDTSTTNTNADRHQGRSTANGDGAEFASTVAPSRITTVMTEPTTTAMWPCADKEHAREVEHVDDEPDHHDDRREQRREVALDVRALPERRPAPRASRRAPAGGSGSSVVDGGGRSSEVSSVMAGAIPSARVPDLATPAATAPATSSALYHRKKRIAMINQMVRPTPIFITRPRSACR